MRSWQTRRLPCVPLSGYSCQSMEFQTLQPFFVSNPGGATQISANMFWINFNHPCCWLSASFSIYAVFSPVCTYSPDIWAELYLPLNTRFKSPLLPSSLTQLSYQREPPAGVLGDYRRKMPGYTRTMMTAARRAMHCWSQDCWSTELAGTSVRQRQEVKRGGKLLFKGPLKHPVNCFIMKDSSLSVNYYLYVHSLLYPNKCKVPHIQINSTGSPSWKLTI